MGVFAGVGSSFFRGDVPFPVGESIEKLLKDRYASTGRWPHDFLDIDFDQWGFDLAILGGSSKKQTATAFRDEAIKRMKARAVK